MQNYLANVVTATENVLAEMFEGEQADWGVIWPHVEYRIGAELDRPVREAVLRILAA